MESSSIYDLRCELKKLKEQTDLQWQDNLYTPLYLQALDICIKTLDSTEQDYENIFKRIDRFNQDMIRRSKRLGTKSKKI